MKYKNLDSYFPKTALTGRAQSHRAAAPQELVAGKLFETKRQMRLSCMDGFIRHIHHDPIGRLVLQEPTEGPLMADGSGITAFLRRTCLGLNMVYLEDCSPERDSEPPRLHPGSTQLAPYWPDF